mgnify:CR=1 FL=1
MPQAVESYLRSLTTSDRARAAAWDVVYSVTDDTEAERMLRALPFSDEVRATLWDARKGIDPQPRTQTPPADTPGAVRRFVGGAAEMLNPVTMAQGAYRAARHPIETANAAVDASAQQFWKAADAWQQGRWSEAAGHGAAGAMPFVGPAAATIGEQIGSGDVAGGLGAAAGLLAPIAVARPTARLARRAGPALQQSAERRVVQALGPTKERFKAIAERRAPEILTRRLGGSRETLQATSASKAAAVGTEIDDLLQREGGRPINPQPVIDALERAKGDFQTTRQVPLAEAIQQGLERAPGARVSGNMVELPIVYEPRAVAQLTSLQRVLSELGPEARVDQIVAIRRAWDKVVSDAGGFQHRAQGGVGQPLKDISEAAAKRQATSAIRQLLSDEVPDLAKVNKEFAFWKDLDVVLRQTLQRTQPQGPSLIGRVREGAGQVAGAVIGGTAGGPVGAGVGAVLTGALGKAAHAAFTSPRWRLVSARTRATLAEAIAGGNPERIAAALGRASAVTGGGTALTSPSESRSRTRTPTPLVPAQAGSEQ